MGCTRRRFLKQAFGSATMLSLAPVAPTLLVRSALAANSPRNVNPTVLVVIQLTGGNDGLNTVVPYRDDEYAVRRPTLRLLPRQLHKIGSELGFHPRMHALWRLYQEGNLSVTQAVGYPNPDGDHQVSMRHWHTGMPHDDACQTGWLGRAVDAGYDPQEVAVPAVDVGLASRPLGLNAERVMIPSVHSLDDWTLHRSSTEPEKGAPPQIDGVAREPRATENLAMDFVDRAIVTAHAASHSIEAIRRSAHNAAYPPFQLARRLQTVADLVRADVGVRIYFTELGGEGFGGFDNHANQTENHGALLHQLSESVAAFADDLQRDRLLDRVLVMTFSEFGRTVRENGRRGTDHGAAAPMLLVGGRLRGGLVGQHPSLTDLESGGGLKHDLDFRRVYATVLDRWLQLPSEPVFGQAFEPLELFRA